MATQTTTQTQTQTQTPSSFSTTKSTDIEIPRGDVDSELIFYSPPADNAIPFNYIETPPPGLPQRNFGEDRHAITVHDLRGREQSFNINTNGFGVLSGITSQEKDFVDDTAIEKTYYPEVEKILLDHVPGAQRIFIFDHTIRRAGPNAKRGPVNRAHIDQTTKAARARVTHHLGDEAAKLLEGRLRLINVWRPLNQSDFDHVVANPLAYADSATVPDDDIVPVEHRYPDRTGETAGVKHNVAGQWYYLSGMRNDERVLLQCYDSQDGARTPHSAFADPRTKADWPGRESVEVRALVFG